MKALKVEIIRLKAEAEKWKRGFELMSKSDEAELEGRVHFQEKAEKCEHELERSRETNAKLYRTIIRRERQIADLKRGKDG